MVKTEKPSGKVLQSPFRFVVPLIILALLMVAAFFISTQVLGLRLPFGNSGESNQSVELTYWGLWESDATMKSILDQYEADNPGVKINYIQQKSTDYRDRLQTALQNGSGPDLFRFHQTWVPMLKNDLATIPSSIYSESEYESIFYPVINASLKSSKGLVGIPLMIDGLGLYYNQRLLASAGQSAPQSWDELRRTAKQLTVVQNGVIERAGISLGTTGNVEHWSDILAVMMLQNAANLKSPNNRLGQDALEFYTIFNRVDKVWDDTLPTSTYAFATGKVAMMIAPSWRAHDVLAINPNLEFAVAPVPQLHETNISWSSFWAEGVSNKTTQAKQQAAWKLLKYLSEKESLRQWYAGISGSARRFGEPFPRVDMADQLIADPIVGAYIKQAPAAQSWYLASYTHDNGINDAIIKYYEDAVNSINSGKTPDQALSTVEQGISQVFQRYNLK
jgi:multiple sugar transport system substrate-binding protein